MLKLGLEGEQEQQPLSSPIHDNVGGSHYYNSGDPNDDQ